MNNSARITAIILAAGLSSRMQEKNKLTRHIHNQRLLNHIIEAAHSSLADNIILVTGHEHEQINAIINQQLCTTVKNPVYQEGIASSIRCGVDAVEADADGVIILLGDMPFVNSRMINTLIKVARQAAANDIIAPFYNKRRGNPILWPRHYFPQLKTLTGDTGAKVLLNQFKEHITPVKIESDAIFFDIDTEEDLEKAKLQPPS